MKLHRSRILRSRLIPCQVLLWHFLSAIPLPTDRVAALALVFSCLLLAAAAMLSEARHFLLAARAISKRADLAIDGGQ